MAAAGAGYVGAAAGYEASIDRYMAHMTSLQGSLQGITGMSVTATLLKRIAFLRARQMQLIAHSQMIEAQALAFTTAYTTKVEMVDIIQNHITHAVAVATNFLGMTQPIINEKEAEYVEMGIQNILVQTTYLAATMANTTFKPFLPGGQMVSGNFTIPPLLLQAVGAAEAAADKVRLAASTAASMVSAMTMKGTQAGAAATQAANRAGAIPKQADAQAAIARLRANQMQSQEQAAGQQMTQQMGQQLIQQIPQQAAQIAQQAGQVPQQAVQQVTQQGQQVFSQMSQLMQGIKPEHQLPGSPGLFDTRPDSPTLDRLAGSSAGTSAMGAALRVGNLNGLSSAGNGFRFPSAWDGPIAGSAAPQAPTGSPAATAAGARPPMSPMMTSGRRGGRDRDKLKRPVTELTPVWGAPEAVPTLSVRELAHRDQVDEQEEATA
ncbi:PPE protein [Mycobacteroides abscessus subsp. massiliense]|nr:PPE protein [Mycobacteroides abscessus subsp. massiliense]